MMLRFFYLSVLVACCCVTGGCSLFEGQEDVSERPSDITLGKLLDNMEKASDPKDIYKNADNYIQRQEIITSVEDGGNVKCEIEIIFQRPYSFRTTTYLNGQRQAADLFVNNEAWHIDYHDRRISKMSGKELERMKMFFAIGDPSNDFRKVFASINVTICLEDGAEYYKMRCTAHDQNIKPFYIYVGKNSFLVKKIAAQSMIGGKETKIISTMERYALYRGIMIPSISKVKIFSDPPMNQECRVIDYRIDSKLPPDTFELPKF